LRRVNGIYYKRDTARSFNEKIENRGETSDEGTTTKDFFFLAGNHRHASGP